MRINPRRVRKVVGLLIVSMLASLGLALAPTRQEVAPIADVPGGHAVVEAVAVDGASAAQVGPGSRWHQIDLRLTRRETKDVARHYRSSLWACREVIAVGAIAVGAIASTAMCTSLVTVCAARAYVKGKRAGVTFSPFGSFCWRY